MKGYPKLKLEKMNTKIIVKMTAKQSNNITDDEATAAPSSDDNKKFVSAPYIRGTSERVWRILGNYNINIYHKPTRTLR